MKWLNKLKSKMAVFALVSMASLFGSSAFAALSTDVTSALETAKNDVAQAGGLVLVAILAAAAYRYIRRAL